MSDAPHACVPPPAADGRFSGPLHRRGFLCVGVSAAGGLAFALTMPSLSSAADAAASAGDTHGAAFAPNAFIRLDRKGIVTLVMPMVEMGQGTYTALPMLLAEELEVGLDQVRLELAPPNDALYANAILHVQTTGLSSSVRAFWLPLRQAGAVGRQLLIGAAARRWGVDPASCVARDGEVMDGQGRRLRYGELAEAAAGLPVPDPDKVTLKSVSDFRLIGTSPRRLDTPAKVNGKAIYGIDAMPRGLRFAAVAQSPVFGGRLASLNDAAALKVQGVRQIVKLNDAFAVVADHMGAARKGVVAAAPQWADGPNAGVGQEDVVRQLEEASHRAGAVARTVGDAAAALAAAARRLDAVYQAPFLAHAAMEPMNCTVDLRKDGCDLWVGTQAPTVTQTLVANLTGLPKAAVRVHNHLLGGGFGRRLEPDGTLLAVRIAQQVSGPVKVVWSREEDLQHDMYRPYYYDRISAGLDASGRPVAWTHRVCGSSVVARFVPPLFKNGLDFDAVEGAAEPPYELPNLFVDYVRVEPPGIPTAFWRGVGPVHNVFIVESFIDELAHLARQDPLAYRQALLARNPRAKAVLDLAADKAGWGRETLTAGWGRGLALQHAFGSYMAQVADVQVRNDGSLRVHRLVTAVDCGLVVHPDSVAAQVEGGSMFGLSAVLRGAITLKNGRVEQGNFHDCAPLRMAEAPRVETHLVPSVEAPGGIGEAATAIVGPAVANAVFVATGRRVRVLPIESALRA